MALPDPQPSLDPRSNPGGPRPASTAPQSKEGPQAKEGSPPSSSGEKRPTGGDRSIGKRPTKSRAGSDSGGAPPAVPVPCAACGADEGEIDRPKFYAIDERTFDLVRCQACGLGYISPRPRLDEHQTLLESDPFFERGYADSLYERGYFERRDIWIDAYDLELERIESQVEYVGRLLQWGAGGGFFSEAARRRGWQVQAAETNKKASDYAEVQFPLQVWRGDVVNAPFEAASFDLALLHDTLAFLPEPKPVLEGLFGFTRPGGHLLITTPGYVNSSLYRFLRRIGGSWLERMCGADLWRSLKLDEEASFGAPYRLHHFHLNSLENLLADSGWKIEDVETDLPRPDYLFERRNLSIKEKIVKGLFQFTGVLMRARVLPAARLRILARRPLR